MHTETASSMLRKAGRDVSCLECGTHWPRDEAARKLAAQGLAPSALHNNCSGKHSGFICLSCDMGVDPMGYVQPEHKAMQAVTRALAETTGARLDADNRAIDGCSIPTYAIPLRALALGFARFGTGIGMSPDRAEAASRLRRAVVANPLMVAGTGRFNSRLMALLGDAVFAKSGAEGVYCAALPALGHGIAVKCDDGAGRAAEVAIAALIARFQPSESEEFAAMQRPRLTNWNGLHVGDLQPASALIG
jgi:L-asparaginase II